MSVWSLINLPKHYSNVTKAINLLFENNKEMVWWQNPKEKMEKVVKEEYQQIKIISSKRHAHLHKILLLSQKGMHWKFCRITKKGKNKRPRKTKKIKRSLQIQLVLYKLRMKVMN